MRLFEDEIINITRISTIGRYHSYVPEGQESVTNRYLNMAPTYELIYNVKNDAKVKFGDSIMHDVTGSLRYLPKGVPVDAYIVETFSNSDCIDIFFDTDAVMPDRALSFTGKEYLKDDFIKICNIWQKKKPGYYLECVAILCSIIRKLKQAEDNYISKSQINKLEGAYDYILDNYLKPDFDYNELCRRTEYQYSQFGRLFKKAYHMTPNKLVTRMKIDYAKELLITGRYSVTEVAEVCGFESVYYFSTVFKKLVGVSPSQLQFKT